MQRNEAAANQIQRFFRQMNWVFWAMVLSILLFFFVAWSYTGAGEVPLRPDLNGMLKIASPISGLALVFLARFLFNGRARSVEPKDKLWQKMDAYRGGAILRILVLDGAAFVNIASFVMTGSFLFLALGAVILMLLFLSKPTVTNFVKELALSETEEQVLRDHISKS